MEREKGERLQGRQEVDGEKQEESWREIYNGGDGEKRRRFQERQEIDG